MSRFIVFGCFLLFAGCGPLQTPMVTRVSEEGQQEIDDSWNRALEPVDHLTRQQWLDLFVASQAYQVGVDNLYMRSEKTFDGGLVIMEVSYNRISPVKDSFTVQVLDHNGKQVRQESYSREEVEDTYNLLNRSAASSEELNRQNDESELEARWKVIHTYFPFANESK